jgi:hypothetical protein
MKLEKDESILRLVSLLDLRQRGWTLVDHWDADLCAVGIASNTDPRRLVYVSTYGKKPGTYDYECETPDGAQPTEYRTIEKGEDVSITMLFAALEQHLGLPRGRETITQEKEEE